MMRGGPTDCAHLDWFRNPAGVAIPDRDVPGLVADLHITDDVLEGVAALVWFAALVQGNEPVPATLHLCAGSWVAQTTPLAPARWLTEPAGVGAEVSR